MARLALLLGILFALGVAASAWAGGLDEARAGLSAQRNGENDLAIRHYTRAIQSGDLSDENLLIALYNRGEAYRHEGRHEQAIRDYTEAIRLDPFYINAWNNRGIVFSERGQDERATATSRRPSVSTGAMRSSGATGAPRMIARAATRGRFATIRRRCASIRAMPTAIRPGGASISVSPASPRRRRI